MNLRIIHVVRQFYPAIGGLEAVVLNLAKQQTEAGHFVRVVTLNKVFGSNEVLPNLDFIGRIEIRRISFFGSRRYPIAPTVLAHLRDGQIVHVHGLDFFCDFLALTQLFHRKRMVLSTHGAFFHTKFARGLKLAWFRLISPFSLSAYAYVAASSASDLALFRPIRSKGIGVVPNGISVNVPVPRQPALKKKQIIYFGRIVAHKGIHKLLSVLCELSLIDEGWSLLLAGRPMDDGTLEGLREEISTRRLEDRVRIFLSPTDRQLSDLMQEGSIFCSASAHEGFGIAVVEACAAGLFPIVSNIPAHRENINSLGAGALVDFNRARECAQIVVESYRTAAWESIATNRIAEDFSWSGRAVRFQEIYNRVRGTTHRLIGNTQVAVCDSDRAIEKVQKSICDRSPLKIAFLNAHLSNLSNLDDKVASALQDFFVLNDGVGLELASLILFGERFPENLNGTDFVPLLLDTLPPGQRLYLLGGRADISKRAAEVFLERWPQHQIVGHHNGFYTEACSSALVAEVKAARPDLTLVAMGCPRQEFWIARHQELVGGVGIGVGALLDFQTGSAPRAPLWLRKIRLEWVYRLCLEPRRLFRRYLIGNWSFMSRIFAQWLLGFRA